MSARRESRARLGVFVVSGLVLTAAGIVALGAGRLFERKVAVHCYFNESVQGLSPGSPISYRGVELGRVSEIHMRSVDEQHGMAMGHQALIEVVCDLIPDRLTHFGGEAPDQRQVLQALRREVAQGLRVRVVWKDITGQKYLELDYVDPDAEENALPKLGFEPAEPYIPSLTERSLTDIQRDLATTLSSLAKIDYQAIGAKVELVLTQLAQTVSDFRADELSAAFRDAANEMRATAADPDLRRGLARIDGITAEMERFGKRANELLANPGIESGLDDLVVAARSLRQTADGLATSLPESLARIDGAVDDVRKAVVDARLGETTAAVRDGIADVGGAARSVSVLREDLGRALRDMADASRAIARLADYLERHPEAVLKGRGAAEGNIR